jgi:molecular chaperone DnaJ
VTGDQQDQYNQQYGGNPFGGGFGGFGGGFTGNPSGQNAGYDQSFKDFWDGIEDFFETGGGKGSASKKGKDILSNIEISFMDSINGCQKTVNFERTSVCGTCNGSKSRPGTGPTKCSTCGGSGKVFYKQGFMSIGMECNACHGEGSVIRNPCTTCYGKGVINSKASETINVPKGVNDGMNLRVARKGHFSSGGQNGDLFVKVKVRPHPYFRRDNFDIHTVNNITISQAVLGAKVQVRTLTGDVTVTIDPGTNDGDTKKLQNYGITKLPPNQTQKGHHFVKFKIVIPTKLTSEQKELFERLNIIEEKPKASSGVDEY